MAALAVASSLPTTFGTVTSVSVVEDVLSAAVEDVLLPLVPEEPLPAIVTSTELPTSTFVPSAIFCSII